MRDLSPHPFESPGEAEVRELLESAGSRPDLPPSDLAKLRAAARAALAGRTISGRDPRWPRRFAFAALILVALGAAGWWLHRDPRRSTPPTVPVAEIEALHGNATVASPGEATRPLIADATLVAGAEVCTAAGGDDTVAIVLGGRVGVRLAAESCLRLTSASSLKLRRGAVYADTGVGARPGAAIVVSTPLGEVRDVGTRFALRLEAAGLRVRVRDGEVVVDRPAGTVAAAAGQELMIAPEGSIERRVIPTFGEGWEWVAAAAPPFAIEGRTLGDLLAWVAHETGWSVRFAEPGIENEVGSVVLHGDVGDLGPAETVLAVLPGAGLEAEIETGTLVVRRRPR